MRCGIECAICEVQCVNMCNIKMCDMWNYVAVVWWALCSGAMWQSVWCSNIVNIPHPILHRATSWTTPHHAPFHITKAHDTTSHSMLSHILNHTTFCAIPNHKSTWHTTPCMLLIPPCTTPHSTSCTIPHDVTHLITSVMWFHMPHAHSISQNVWHHISHGVQYAVVRFCEAWCVLCYMKRCGMWCS